MTLRFDGRGYEQYASAFREVFRAKKYVDRVIVMDDGSSYMLEQLFFAQVGRARR